MSASASGLSYPAVCVRDIVRSATEDCHRRLEALPSQTRLMAKDFDLAEYRSTLLRLHGFYEPLAAAFAQHAPTLIAGVRLRRRVEALQCDLFELCYSPADLAAAPLCGSLPSLETFDRALGCAYVIEGSSLGGRMIFAHILRYAGAVPLRFFAGDGEGTSLAWKQFCAQLNAEAVRVDEVCLGACKTFDALAAWLDVPQFARATPMIRA